MSSSNPHLTGVLLFAAGCGTTPGAASGVDASKADGGGVLDAAMDVPLPDDAHAEDRANSDSGTAPDAADSRADGPIGHAGPCVEGTSCSAERYGAPLAEHPDAGHDLTTDATEWVVSELLGFRQRLAIAEPRGADAPMP